VFAITRTRGVQFDILIASCQRVASWIHQETRMYSWQYLPARPSPSVCRWYETTIKQTLPPSNPCFWDLLRGCFFGGPVTISRAKHHDSDNRGTAEVACGHATATTIFHWARAVIDIAYCEYCTGPSFLHFWVARNHFLMIHCSLLLTPADLMNDDMEGRSIPNTCKISSYHLCKRSSSIPSQSMIDI